ncbi:hypothetical protein [Geodermatophilus sp. SYSU D01176]
MLVQHAHALDQQIPRWTGARELVGDHPVVQEPGARWPAGRDDQLEDVLGLRDRRRDSVGRRHDRTSVHRNADGVSQPPGERPDLVHLTR